MNRLWVKPAIVQIITGFTMKTTITLLILLTLFSLNIFAQDSPQWHLPKGAKMRFGKGTINDIQYSPDGRTIVSGSHDKTIRLWDAESGTPKRTLTGHTERVFSVAFSPDGRTLATGSYNTIRLWDAESGVHNCTLGHTERVLSVAFSPDGRTIASGSRDKTIRLWDAESEAHNRTLTGHTSGVLSVAFSPDGRTLASGSWDIRLWDAESGAHKRTLTGYRRYPVYSVAFSPDGRTIATGNWETIRFWDAETGAHKRTLWHGEMVFSVAFSPDGRTLASGNYDNTIGLWDAESGAHNRTLTGHTSYVNSVAFSPDGRTIASGSGSSFRDDNTIRFWDAESGAHNRTLTGHTSYVRSVAFSPDGRTLASGSYDKTIRLWDAESGAHNRTLIGHTSGVNSIAFSPDGRTLASGSEDGTVLLWELTPSTTTYATVSVAPSPVQSPAIGEQLTLSLKITGGENVAGYQATVGFDSTALRYMASATGDYLPTGAFFVQPVVKENQVTVAATALAGVGKGEGTLASLTFEVVALKASTLTLSQVNLVDPDGQRSVPLVKGAQVIEPPQIFGDVNSDGVVNIQDLVLVGSNFRQTGENSADVNRDGVVDIVDLVLVAGAIRNAATAPAGHPQALGSHGMGNPSPTVADVQGWLTQAWGLALTDATFQRGVVFLANLLAALTPKETTLLPNYPNPFNPETWIPYHLAHAADVTLTIYNTKGAVVRRFELGHRPAGFYTARANAAYWNGRNASGELVASGVYFYQLRAGGYSALRRMVILK